MAICYTRRTSKQTKAARDNPLTRPIQIKKPLSDFVKTERMPRTQITKAVWNFAKKHNLNEGRLIAVKGALEKLFPKKHFPRGKIDGIRDMQAMISLWHVKDKDQKQ